MKINETQYCDHTLNIHVSSFRETHITAIDHRFLMRKKYHGQRKDGLKCHTNSRRKYNMNHQLITSPLGVFVLDIDDCVNHTCTNGASCIDGINGFSCNCSVGFSGKHCERSKYSAMESRMASSRQLSTSIITFALFLSNFPADLNDCVNHNCSNGASCIDGINSYSCNCSAGFTGLNCQRGRENTNKTACYFTGLTFRY